MSRARTSLAWTSLALLLATSAAVAQDASGGPDKSIAPKSLSGTTGSNPGASSSESTVRPSDPPGAAGTQPDGTRRGGGTAPGTNNTMDDSGTAGSVPGDAPRR